MTSTHALLWGKMFKQWNRSRTPGSLASAHRQFDHQSQSYQKGVPGMLGGGMLFKCVCLHHCSWLMLIPMTAAPVSCVRSHAVPSGVARVTRGAPAPLRWARATPHGLNTQSRLHQQFTQLNPQPKKKKKPLFNANIRAASDSRVGRLIKHH